MKATGDSITRLNTITLVGKSVVRTNMLGRRSRIKANRVLRILNWAMLGEIRLSNSRSN